ncbi:hypothetical protein FRX31_027629 [Thalictrum thalictroides]|uniref:Uncharacterized protein n=1 Tax=Thalictrum thalictroides TaxID=46969 RepID=A0A7J6VDG3_THATH|nr:hypothetical protein FRX31_027629 [Thalictrum thalictroides]
MRHQNKSFRGGSHMLICRRVAVQRFYAETKKILFWSYGTSKDIKLPMKTMVATEVEMKMGPMIETVVLYRQSNKGEKVDLHGVDEVLER